MCLRIIWKSKITCEYNTITCMDDIIGFDLIKDSERMRILQHWWTRVTQKERYPTPKKLRRSLWKNAPKQEWPVWSRPTFQPLTYCTQNADQLRSSKMTELKKLVERQKPLVIAVCEVKPKHRKSGRSEKDYEIPNYTLHPPNLYNNDGRGIAVYTHQSLDKSTIQIRSNQNFQEVCLFEIR